MTQPAREKRSTERGSPSSPTRVQKGRFTIDMRPKPTPSISATKIVFRNWAERYPLRVAAQYAAIPTGFEGIEEDIAEIKRLGQNPTIRGVHIHTETPEAEA